MILPKARDPRLITIRRGGTLTDADHQLLALWAAVCAAHVLPLFESVQPADLRPRQAIAQIRAWVHGEITMSQARAAGGHAMAAARDLRGAARYAAFAAGQAAVVAHVAAHELGAAAYALKKPNPWPTVFGYHEVFHAFVVLAAACHFVSVSLVVLKLR